LGGQALCPACGARFDIPPAPLLGPQTPDAKAVAIETATSLTSASASDPGPEAPAEAVFLGALAPIEDATAANSPAFGALAASGGTEPPTPPGLLPPANAAPTAEEVRAVLREVGHDDPSRWHPLWWLVAGMLACAVLLLGTFAILRESDSWDQDHRAAVINLKIKAESLGAAGQLEESQQEYRRLDKLIGGRDIRDPQLKQLIESARIDQDRIYHALLANILERNRPQSRAANATSPATPGPAPSVAPGVAAAQSIATRSPEANPAPAPAAAGLGGPTSSPRPGPASAGQHEPAAAPASGPAIPPATSPASPTPTPVQAARPAPRPLPNDPQLLTDDRIGQAIQSGVNYLFTQFNSRHVLSDVENVDPSWSCGQDSLAVYALLQCGQAISDPRLNIRGAEMKALIEAMKRMPLEGTWQTYARGIHATALADPDLR
jgi:hypothetical protein